MADLTLRTVKGSALTFSEVDNNFSNINTELVTLGKRVYRPIATVVAIPTNVTTPPAANDDLIELLDSTGIESSSLVQGVPSGFVGSSTLTARLQYSSAASKWVWVDYASKGAAIMTRSTAKAWNWNALTTNQVLEFTDVPAWAKRIAVIFSGIAHTSTAYPLLQLGTAAQYVSSNYISTSGFVSATSGAAYHQAGFIVNLPSAADSLSGSMVLTQVSGNTWTASHAGRGDTNYAVTGGGHVDAGAVVTRLRLALTTTANSASVTGTQTYSAGTVNVLYEGFA